MAECTFCSIAAGTVRAEVVLEGSEVVGFLDARPLFPGHVLVVPRRHIPTLDDLPDDLVSPLFSAVRRLGRAVRSAASAQGTFVAMNNVVSQSVPHLHVHVVPRSKGDGLRGFFWPRQGYRDDPHRLTVANAIRNALKDDPAPPG